MREKITKAIFPVAGLGSRFLPATKASPKEMLPVVDKPLIQYAVEEALEAGIQEMIFVTGRNKSVVLDHFARDSELESLLDRDGKEDLLSLVRGILPSGVKCTYVTQEQPLGLGHAILCASAAVGGQHFAVLLPDDIILTSGEGCLSQMIRMRQSNFSGLVALQKVPDRDISKYGIVSLQNPSGRLSRITDIVEKPESCEAPSNLAVVGRYVLPPETMSILESTSAGANGEIQLTDALATLLSEESLMGYEFDGMRFDCGTKLGYLQANVEYGLRHLQTGEEFRDWCQRRFRDFGSGI